MTEKIILTNEELTDLVMEIIRTLKLVEEALRIQTDINQVNIDRGLV